MPSPWIATSDTRFLAPTACASPQTACNNRYVDAQTDPQNCGSYGNMVWPQPLDIFSRVPNTDKKLQCASGVCAGGQCGCPASQTKCGDLCVNTNTDPNNCGSCGHVVRPFLPSNPLLPSSLAHD
jgi:hypothetical protein